MMLGACKQRFSDSQITAAVVSKRSHDLAGDSSILLHSAPNKGSHFQQPMTFSLFQGCGIQLNF